MPLHVTIDCSTHIVALGTSTLLTAIQDLLQQESDRKDFGLLCVCMYAARLKDTIPID